MKISRIYLWHKLAGIIHKIIPENFYSKIEGLSQSQENLIFVLHHQSKVIYQASGYSYTIRIKLKREIAELVTLRNLDLFQQHFSDFIYTKYKNFKETLLLTLLQGEIEWEFTLNDLDTPDFYCAKLRIRNNHENDL